MPTPTLVSQVNNPITGVFGNGFVQVFGLSGTWTVPEGVNNVRVRIFGAGAAGGGGFAIKTIYNLAGSGVSTVAVTVAAGVSHNSTSGGTSSFGSYCSATAGTYTASAASAGGTGVGGDINYTGGSGWGGNSGGGVANIFGPGGNSQQSATGSGSSGTSGGGSSSSTTNYTGGSGLTGTGGYYGTQAYPATPGNTLLSIDYFGTGGGGAYLQPGANGGGGGQGGGGGFPGGGAGSSGTGGSGMVIVEY